MAHPERFGSYEIVELLGEGATGTVFRARSADGKEVALKLLSDGVADDAEVAYRFRREMRIARTVDHRNVVRTLDAGAGDGRLYLVCELVEGGTLADRIPLGEEQAVAVMRDLFAALDAVHRAGLIHRDVKPLNILLTRDGTAKLCDLGLARSTSPDRTQFTGEGMVIGSPAYLSPEQVQGAAELDIRCDLYAAGVVLYECLTGKTPYEAEDVLKMVWMHVEAPVPSLPEGVAPELADLCAALLAKNPADRPPSPRAAAERLPRVAYPETIDERVAFPATLDDHGQVFGSGVSAATIEREREAAAAVPEPGAPVELPALDDAQPLARARLTSGGKTLFVYAGSRLQMGRDSSGQDICLRVPGDADASRRISRTHLRLLVSGHTARIVDLETTSGTKVGGQPLAPGEPRLLATRSRVDVAGVLRLDVTVVAAPTSAPPAGADAIAPALYADRGDAAYALVPGRLVLFGLEPHDAGGTEIFAAGGGLWLREKDGRRPLTDGLAFDDIDVADISTEDQK